MKTKEIMGLFKLISLEKPEVNFLIDKTKLLIGSDPRCDIFIDDEFISGLQCLLVLKSEGVMVKDLHSENGVFINGTRISSDSFLNPGDILVIGHSRFSLVEVLNDFNVLDCDARVHKLSQEVFHPISTKSNLVFIDGEFCDIKFDDDKFMPIMDLPNVELSQDRIDIDEMDAPFDLGKEIKGLRLEVINYINGIMMDVRYIPLKDGDYFISSSKKAKNFITFYSNIDDQKLFTVLRGKLKIHDLTGLSSSPSSNLTKPMFFTSGVEQLSLRLIDHTYSWQGLPLFFRDRHFFKDSGRVFASLFLPLLLLLFITLPKKEQIQEIAVVYKLPEEQKKVVEAEMKSEKVNRQVSSVQPQKSKTIATNTVPAAPKAYEFNSDISLDALAGKLKLQGEGKGHSVAEDFKTGNADKVSSFGSGEVSIKKFNAGNGQGNEFSSYGSKGLVSKQGFDSTSMDTKTVVLGSMDPELLRKILREYIPQFRHCYQQELIGGDDSLKGVIDLNFTISGEGRVAKFDINAKDARFSKKGVKCMGQVLSLIDFPRPKGGGMVDVKQPLNFSYESQKI